MSKIDMTAKSGDWRWAGAMLYSGHRIRLETWAEPDLAIELRSDGFFYWCGTDDTYDDVIAERRDGLLWELYAEPAPAPAPKPVRWKLKRFDGALRTTGVGACGIPIDALVSRDWHGHRLLNFICIPPEGNGVEWRTGSLPFVFYDPTRAPDAWLVDPRGPFTIQLWASEVEMMPVDV